MKNEELYFYIRMLQQISIFISVYSSSIQYDRITTLGNVDVFTNRYTLPIMALCGSDIKRYQAAQAGTTYSNTSTITNNN